MPSIYQYLNTLFNEEILFEIIWLSLLSELLSFHVDVETHLFLNCIYILNWVHPLNQTTASNLRQEKNGQNENPYMELNGMLPIAVHNELRNQESWYKQLPIEFNSGPLSTSC